MARQKPAMRAADHGNLVGEDRALAGKVLQCRHAVLHVRGPYIAGKALQGRLAEARRSPIVDSYDVIAASGEERDGWNELRAVGGVRAPMRHQERGSRGFLVLIRANKCRLKCLDGVNIRVEGRDFRDGGADRFQSRPSELGAGVDHPGHVDLLPSRQGIFEGLKRCHPLRKETTGHIRSARLRQDVPIAGCAQKGPAAAGVEGRRVAGCALGARAENFPIRHVQRHDRRLAPPLDRGEQYGVPVEGQGGAICQYRGVHPRKVTRSPV
mmetsp:Transcript_1264/g.4128  ORF Transcript_1264/g.4128 Transcript_1264/m.4128 type:complete len:268 (-) Transcript_1264:654-1457(-)